MAGSGEARPAAATVGPLIGFLQLHWLGRERIAAYSAILALGGLVSLYWFFRQAIGPQGSDFLAFWSAGRLTIRRRWGRFRPKSGVPTSSLSSIRRPCCWGSGRLA